MTKSPWQIVRKIPYTEKGILRIKCIRCGEQAIYQWQICADGNNYRPFCKRCDVELNRAVLKFMKHPHVNEVIDSYEIEVMESDG